MQHNDLRQRQYQQWFRLQVARKLLVLFVHLALVKIQEHLQPTVIIRIIFSFVCSSPRFRSYFHTLSIYKLNHNKGTQNVP